MRSLRPNRGRQALDLVDAIEASKTTACDISRFERVNRQSLPDISICLPACIRQAQ